MVRTHTQIQMTVVQIMIAAVPVVCGQESGLELIVR